MTDRWRGELDSNSIFFKVFNKCFLYGTCVFTQAVSEKIKDFQWPRYSNSRTFKDQPFFQGLSRPWI